MVLRKNVLNYRGGKHFAMTSKPLKLFWPMCPENLFLTNNNVVYNT